MIFKLGVKQWWGGYYQNLLQTKNLTGIKRVRLSIYMYKLKYNCSSV